MGTIRQLPSGHWQARAWDSLTGQKVTLGTYRTKGEAKANIRSAETDMARGTWTDPKYAKVLFADYAEQWLSERTGLGEGTRQLYEGLLRNHIVPAFGKRTLLQIQPAAVRSWNSKLVALDNSRPGRRGSIAPKSYRLLKTVMGTAVTDLIIPTNPVNIKSAGDERPNERPPVTIEETYLLAEAVGEVVTGHGAKSTHAAQKYRAVVLLAAFSGLRLGEMRGLRLRNLDLDAGTVRVVEQYQDGHRVGDPPGTSGYWDQPKSAAGFRLVHLPETITEEMQTYVLTLTHTNPDDLVFPGEGKNTPRSVQDPGRPFSETAWNRRFHAAVATVPSLVGKEKIHNVTLHLHDLRHFALNMAGKTPGVNDKEKMAHGGHSSAQAHRIYLHASTAGSAAIAEHMDAQIREALPVVLTV